MSSERRLRRLSKLLKRDGRTVIVAFDHGLLLGPVPGSEEPKWVLEQVIEGGADGVIVSPGLVRKFADVLRGRIGIILTIPLDQRFVEYAAKMGADAVKTTFYGDMNDANVFERQQYVAMACEYQGLPYVNEVIPAAPGSYKPIPDQAMVRLGVRKAAELGADIVKTVYTGDRSRFREVVESTFIPVVILGGEKSDDEYVLQMVEDVIDVGGAGVAFGRNVWSRANPKTMVKALGAIVHEGKRAEEALRIVRR